MAGSRLYLGADAAYERQLRESANCDLRQLHRGAQRVAWGVIMGERVGIDLDVEVARLLRTCGEHFAAHVSAAFARRSQRRETDADWHLARARELLPAGHPWAALVPDEARFREALPSQLVEEIP